jgi:SulP family sulfate permease
LNFRQLLPEWIQRYQRPDLRHDLIAGLTVGVMLIPQGMAYAMLAGLPPIYGLYASALPPVLYALFGTCRQLSVGPGAVVALMTASGIGLIAQSGTEQYIALIALLSLAVGLIQFCFGIGRLGFLVHFLSNPVVQGFTSAAVIIIVISQLKLWLGIPLVKSQYVHDLLLALGQQITDIHILTFVIGFIGLLLLLAAQKWIPRFPAALVLVIMATILTAVFRLDLHGVSIVGNIQRGFPFPSLPHMDMVSFLAVLSTAFAVALISFTESTAVARRLQVKHASYRVIPDKDLMALGLSNMMSAVFKTMPVTGGMTRSMVNDYAGARSGLASLISSALIAIVMIALSPLLFYLPHAVLASVILVAVYKLLRIREAINLWKLDRRDFYMLLATFIGTLFLGISFGIAIGVILSLAWIIFESSYPHHAELGRVPGTHTFRNLRRFHELQTSPGVLIIRFDAQLFFANANYFREIVMDYKSHRTDTIHSIVIDMETVNTIDSSAIDILTGIINELKKEGIQLFLVEIKGPVRDKLQKAGLIHQPGEHNHFVTIDDALAYIERQTN